METTNLQEHSVAYARKLLTVTGVVDVPEFSDTELFCNLADNGLMIRGNGLNITKLDTKNGNLLVEGEVISLQYTRSKEKSGFFKRLFK